MAPDEEVKSSPEPAAGGPQDIDLTGSIPSGAKALLPPGEVQSLVGIFESADAPKPAEAVADRPPAKAKAASAPIKEGNITQWVMAQIAKAILDLGIEAEGDQLSQLEDAVWQAALSGGLGNGQVSDVTSQAIFDMVRQLTANMPRVSPEDGVEPEDLLPPGDKLADLPEPEEEPPLPEPEEEPEEEEEGRG